MLDNLDLQLFHLINGLAGQYWVLDRIVESQHVPLFRGGLLLGLYWMFWFRRGAGQQDRRATILAAIAGALVALVVARSLAVALPFRARPIYGLTSGVRLPSFPMHLDMEDWSAFPSDTATYFVALAAGFWFLWRPLGVALVVWALGYICLPRVFLAIHYPSDIAAGAVIGVLSVASVQLSAVKSWIARPVLALEHARPDLFYPLMFLLSYEFVVVFADLRNPLRTIAHELPRYGIVWASENIILLVACLLLILFIALAVCYRRGPKVARRTQNEACHQSRRCKVEGE